MKNPTIEAIKEVGRYLVFLLLGIVVDVALVFVGDLNPVASFAVPVEIQVVIILGVQNFLRATDKYIHENENIDSKGLVNF